MKTNDFKGDAWPTPLQTLLLHACLDQDNQAVTAWQDWKKQADIDHLDHGSFRLLSLLYHNLQSNHIDDPLMPRLKGIFRMDWYKNKMIFHAGTRALKALHEKNIPTLLLKGAALNEFYYKDQGLRPMGDFDVLVPSHHAKAAVQVLAAAGFKGKVGYPDFENLSESFFHNRHAYSFVDAQGYEIDLHWYAMHYCYSPNIDGSFWERAIPITFGDIETKTLQPLDMLLHVCVHGSRWNPIPPMRWIIDAMMVLKMTDENTNWQSLTDEIKARHFVVPMRFMLEHLKVDYGAAIPNKVLQDLSAAPVRKFEYWQYRITNKAYHSGQVIVSSLAILLGYYRHQILNHKTVLEIMNPLALVSYLQRMLNFSSSSKTLRWIGSRLLTRTTQDVRMLLRK